MLQTKFSLKLAAACLAFAAALCPGAGDALDAGDQAPAFLMRFLDGSIVNYREKCGSEPLILSFFDHNCPPCRIEIPFLQRMKDRHPSATVILVAGQSTGAPDARNFIKGIERSSGTAISLPVALDRHGDIENAYGVKSHPETFVIGRGCRILKAIKGYSPEKEREIEEALE